jgi:hypothetical protein
MQFTVCYSNVLEGYDQVLEAPTRSRQQLLPCMRHIEHRTCAGGSRSFLQGLLRNDGHHDPKTAAARVRMNGTNTGSGWQSHPRAN